MNSIVKTVRKILYFLLGRGEYHIPNKDEIADMIDARLGCDNGRDDGKIITHKRNGYRYYITRSPLEIRKGL